MLSNKLPFKNVGADRTSIDGFYVEARKRLDTIDDFRNEMNIII